MTASRTAVRQTRRGWMLTAAIVLLSLVAFEGAMRLAEQRVGVPSTWPTDEMAVKYDQLTALGRAGTPPDVILVGSSAVFEGLDPVTYSTEAPGGALAFNAALGAASMLSIERWTSDIVLDLADADTVVIGVISRDLNDNGIGQREFYDRLASSHDFTQASGAVDPNPANRIDAFLNDHLASWQMRPRLRQPVTFARDVGAGRHQESTVHLGPQGAEPEDEYEFDYVVDEEWRTFWRDRQLHDYSIGGDEAAALRSLVDDVTSRGASVVLVSMPVTDDYLALLPNGADDQADFEALLQDIAEIDGVSYFDADTVIDGVDFFRDPAHLNPDGAQILTIALATMPPG